ncbi:GntR family transcriptional regulator [Thalassobaculum salexigens]|uniref:GntR family transcriptional regulator n=1 Tax=Thalassobaculum salexigens TaxID=455360 RepID=UPI00048B517F|nr:GntR family transcriptional regulator [Thalassobaculum salexigens]
MTKNPFSIAGSVTSEDAMRGGPRLTTSARVYGEIRERIIALDLPPDTILVRSELADRFTVSQSPVREAILRLEQDGLVISYPQSRTMVTRIDTARVREEHFLRTAVECEVVRRLAEARDADALKKARGFLKMQEALVEDMDQVDLFKQLDDAFHAALFASVNQSSLHQHIQARCGHLARLRTLDLPSPGKTASVLDAHRAVVDAIETGDGDLSVRTMREHLSGSLRRMPQIVEEHAELFC